MPVRVIKKYPNRRLYDTRISSYITIEDVRQLIVDGEEFEVRDAKTGEDLTRCVPLQIIAEHEQEGEPMLSTQLVSQIIRFYSDSLQGFMGNYLERSMQMFLEQQQQCRQQMSGLIGQAPWTMLNQLTEKNLEERLAQQEEALASAATFVRPGGTLVYVTCSVLPEENENQVYSFCEDNPEFEILSAAGAWEELFGTDKPQPWSADMKTVTLTPASTETDGFFFCAMGRRG